MRIVAGRYKGRKLQAGKDLSIRPTTDRVKEYIFQIVDEYIVDKDVVDIFAGSGSLGLEALSRGARHVTFVEKSHRSVSVLEKNLTALEIPADQYTIIHQAAEMFIRTNRHEFDIYFLDPPFAIEGLQVLMNNLMRSRFLGYRDLVIIEHEVSNPLAVTSDIYELFKQKKMGRSLISFLQKRGEKNE